MENQCDKHVDQCEIYNCLDTENIVEFIDQTHTIKTEYLQTNWKQKLKH